MRRALVGGGGVLLLLGIMAGPLLELGTPSPRIYTVDEVQVGVQRYPHQRETNTIFRACVDTGRAAGRWE